MPNVKMVFLAVIDMFKIVWECMKMNWSTMIFAIQMDETLKEDFPEMGRSWQDLTPQHLLREMRKQVDTLETAYQTNDGEAVITANARLANLAMISAENYAVDIIQQEMTESDSN